MNLWQAMVSAVRRIGCNPICKRCVRRAERVYTTSPIVGWWICSRCGEWVTDLEEASWVR